jgi:hypothetical protein
MQPTPGAGVRNSLGSWLETQLEVAGMPASFRDEHSENPEQPFFSNAKVPLGGRTGTKNWLWHMACT